MPSAVILMAMGCASSTSSAPPATAPTAPTQPQDVSSSELEGRRISGSLYNPPDAGTKQAMKDDGVKKVVASFKVCVDPAGAVESVTKLRSTGYVIYDNRLTSALKTWTYRPVHVDGKPTAACTAVTFIYSTK